MPAPPRRQSLTSLQRTKQRASSFNLHSQHSASSWPASCSSCRFVHMLKSGLLRTEEHALFERHRQSGWLPMATKAFTPRVSAVSRVGCWRAPSMNVMCATKNVAAEYRADEKGPQRQVCGPFICAGGLNTAIAPVPSWCRPAVRGPCPALPNGGRNPEPLRNRRLEFSMNGHEHRTGNRTVCNANAAPERSGACRHTPSWWGSFEKPPTWV